MQTLRKKTSPLKYRNEPARFFGDGVIFKAKLIGILEVGEARGDRMCQEALQDLKMAIRAAGEHKQRITIHVTIEGLRLRDEKTGESLYHHPVHKISFIAQDMTDSRAFGYIFGSPDCGHRFFGIKTDKAASQVVLAMRDLFQCVFELKKKEIELAKQHIQSRISSHDHQPSKSSALDHKKGSSSLLGESSSKPKAEKSPEATANLVDLEQELSSIQRGITQMERITPSEEGPKSVVSLDDDPFGDSFSSYSPTPFNILPPPASSKRNQQQQQKLNDSDTMAELSQIMSKATTPPIPPFPSSQSSSNNADWLNQTATSSSVFDEDANSNSFTDDSINANSKSPKNDIIDAFSDLDPLGTGKNKPYVDKKYFFQDLKNPPKKLLRDLSEPESIFDAHFSPMKTPRPSSNLDNSQSQNNNSNSGIQDPFDDEDFSKICVEPFEQQTKSVSPKSIILPDTKISSFSSEEKKEDEQKKSDAEMTHQDSWTSTSSYSDVKRLERQTSDGSSRNVFSVDSFSKKLPMSNLFGQRNVKRDSNGINMRRLQESDSLSENEPELPPRPEIGSNYHDPPPLPPKAGRDSYTDRYGRTTSTTSSTYSRYDYTSKYKTQSTDSPPLPLPSRKVNRSENSYSSTSATARYRKPPTEQEDDYLTPSEIPTILPPPNMSKNRGKPRKSETDPINLDAPTPTITTSVPLDMPPTLLAPILPDITLSQLLTLGIDDLAQKLNVPASKLSTMTIVELTKYLSEFIEKSKYQQQQQQRRASESPKNDSPVFKVNFDDDSNTMFVAKFDDEFGETPLSSHQSENNNTFVANFDNFNQVPVSVIPTADRYAVFREIIDQDIQQQQQDSFHQESIESNNSNSLEEAMDANEFQREMMDKPFSPAFDQFRPNSTSLQVVAKIDTTITEAISSAKDRYAALRDLVLVEDLFDKSAIPPLASISDSNLSDDIEDGEQAFESAEVAGDNNSLDNVPTYSVSWADAEAMPEAEIGDIVAEEEIEQQQDDQNSLQIVSTSNKDDFEIDEYMKKAISELSLDQRLSPNIQCKSPNISSAKQPSPSPTNQQLQKPSPSLNDMSTSPIPLAPKSPLIREETAEELVENQSAINENVEREKTITPSIDEAKPSNDANESWAVFAAAEETSITTSTTMTKKEKSTTPTNNNVLVQGKPPTGVDRGKESPVSSEGKNSELKQREKEYQRKWPKHHTSSSSRDVSPWDEDAPASTGDYRRRSRPSHHDSHHSTSERYARPPQPRRRMNSCDEEYDEEYERRQHAASQRARGFKGNVHRSREILNSGENPNWRYPNEQWSDDEDDERIQDRSRQFDRNALRSTYGPPYDKREPKSLPYDRRVHDKRSKYYRPNRNEPYEYDPYDVPPPSGRGKSRKEFDDYEPGAFERGSRESRSAREFFYDRDRKSFDSNESYESGGRGGHRMGSGEIYGSYESRGEYRDRERYFAGQSRPRRSHRSRGELNDEDSEEEQGQRRITESTGSLQRPGGSSRTSKHIQLDDDIWGVGPKQQWKRPSSADRLSGSGGLSGSEDNESEKRHRRKTRPPKGKEVELRSNYATIRHPSHHQQRREYFEYDEESAAGFEDEPPRNISPRSQEHEYYGRRKPPHGPSQRNFSSTRSDSKGFNEYSKPRYPDDEEYDARKRGQGPFKKSSSRDLYVDDSRGGDYYQKPGFDDDEPTNVRRQSNKRMDYGEEFQQAQQQQQQQRPPSGQSQGGNNKFNFDGFESDFIASPKQADQQKTGSQQKFSFDSELSPSPNLNKNSSSQQRLRFSENVSVSKFDSNSSSQQMFEDDFAEWTADTPQASSNIQSSLKKGNSSNLKNNSFFARHENLKKSDSVNIFARKNDEDPFENDDFFASEGKNQPNTGEQDPFQWSNKNNFANFDDNKNI